MLTLTKYLRQYKLLLLIIVLGGILRFIFPSTPPSLNWDEVSHGYNAYSILKTGRDEWGNLMPIIFRAYGDYKLPVYIYLTVISEFLFGLTTFAVRLPSLLAGIGTIFFTYFLVLELFVSKNGSKVSLQNTQYLAIVTALLVAIEPWTFFLSRAAFEANLALFFFVAGVYFFLKFVRKQHSTSYILLSTFFLGLTVWTYNSYRIFTPLMLVVLNLVYWSDFSSLLTKNKKLATYYILLATFFLLPMFYQLVRTEGSARYSKVTIIDQGAINKIEESRNNNNYPVFIEKIIYNKAVFFAKTALSNWHSYLSPKFLFIEGGSQYQYSLPGQGQIYLVEFPLFYIGLAVAIYYSLKKQKWAMIILAWTLISPIPASITRDTYHPLRSAVMLPVPMLLSAIGLISILNFFYKKTYSIKNQNSTSNLLLPSFLLLLLLSSFMFLTGYFVQYKKDYSWAWQFGHKEAVDFVKPIYKNYDKVIVTKKYGEPHIFFLFYGAGNKSFEAWPEDPEMYDSDPNLIRYKQTDWYWVDRFDKIYFANDWELPTRSDQDFVLESGLEFDCDFTKCLLVTSPGTHQPDWKLLHTVYFLDGKPAFEIYEN